MSGRTSLAILWVCGVLAAAAAGFLLGAGTGPDLDQSRARGAEMGERDGYRGGYETGVKQGRSKGRKAGYDRAFARSYRREFKAAFVNEGLEAPKVKVPR